MLAAFYIIFVYFFSIFTIIAKFAAFYATFICCLSIFALIARFFNTLGIISRFLDIVKFCLQLEKLTKKVFNVIKFVLKKEKSMKFEYKIAILYFWYVLNRKLEKSYYNGFLLFYNVIIGIVARLNIRKTYKLISNYSNISTNTSFDTSTNVSIDTSINVFIGTFFDNSIYYRRFNSNNYRIS